MRYGDTWTTRPENIVMFNRKEEIILAQDEHIIKVSYFVAFLRRLACLTLT
jgi:hypothetical protein